ncbi:MAG: pseudouridylate synthase, partial [Armatimonadetes bacterium]|nr:pseudouridylate synthase [Armatimonadota bacterium]
MRRLRLTLEYDGTGFRGFQRQPGQVTVQGELERRLSLICGHPVELTGAGRTDAGVHALGQVVHFDTTGRIPADGVSRAVNSLGSELVVRHVEETTPAFHARFSAVRRTYHYYVCGFQPSPFLGRHALCEPRLRDDAAQRMEQALRPLLGTHDFTALATAGFTGPAVRTLFEGRMRERGRLLRVELTADGFLRSMVRVITGWLVEIGRGCREPEALGEA